ncbi:MAG TPA: caspase family protein [Thermoanaerobaculia bacterium]|nr:caspase family protein [Thermoanaerobaculia bacterium]
MSLYWPPEEQDIDLTGPRLHAIVIGAGEYPHLKPGAPNAAGTNFGLGQLTTTTITAKRIAEWLATKYTNTAVQFGSIELLLSPGEQVTRPDGKDVVIEEATLANITDAFRKRWLKRCLAQPGGIAFFYFAGHGLSAGAAQYLLPSDFSDPAGTRWERCIDFKASRSGMGHVKATQLFFVDACRETPIDALTQANPPTGARLVDDATMFDQPASIATYYAAAQGLQAYGPEDDATYFATAVIDSLDGAAALNRNGKLQVDTFTLSNALGQIISSIAADLNKPLACNPDPSGVAATIHTPPAAHVRTSIGCQTPQANAESAILLQRGGVAIQSAAGQDRPWTGRLTPGDWNIHLTFQNFPQQTRTETLMPPLFELEVEL